MGKTNYKHEIIQRDVIFFDEPQYHKVMERYDLSDWTLRLVEPMRRSGSMDTTGRWRAIFEREVPASISRLVVAQLLPPDPQRNSKRVGVT